MGTRLMHALLECDGLVSCSDVMHKLKLNVSSDSHDIILLVSFPYMVSACLGEAHPNYYYV